MATTAETLFREKSVVGVRDYNLNLKQEITRARDTFDKELSKRYTDILAVTDEVEILLQKARLADTSLMDLCFNDSKCKLETISEPAKGLSAQLEFINGYNSATAEDFGPPDEACCTLAVSEWVLAVLEFVQDPGSLKNLDSLVNRFTTLNQVKVPEELYAIIAHKCESLESVILQHNLSLTASHWVRLHELFHADQRAPFFKFNEVHAIDDLAFDFLLGNEDYLQRSATEIEVQNFFKTPVYRAKSIERALKLIDDQFQKYDSCELTDKQSDLALYGDIDMQSLQLFIENVDSFCKGVIAAKDQELNTLVERVVETIGKLKSAGADTAVLADIKARLTSRVQKRLVELENEFHEPDVIALKSLESVDTEQSSKAELGGPNKLHDLQSVEEKGDIDAHKTLSPETDQILIAQSEAEAEQGTTDSKDIKDTPKSAREKVEKSSEQTQELSEQIEGQGPGKENTPVIKTPNDGELKPVDPKQETLQLEPSKLENESEESEIPETLENQDHSSSPTPKIEISAHDETIITSKSSEALVNTALNITNALNLQNHLKSQIQLIQTL
ncbi:LAFA_0D01310g1_1 [Lachancea sp. 'fantastica']|nr:LAFA_0D01310g1_1 [Lachancea sp. 'fantastica']